LDHLVWYEILRLLEDPTLIQNELNRRLEAARDASPTQRRLETLNRDLIRVRKSMERLLTVYQEELLSLDELRVRMPPLRQREQAMQAELQAINNQTADRAAYLRLAETLTAFLERLRSNAQTLDIGQRQRVMRLLVKEVIVGKDLITIKHSIPGQAAPTGGDPPSSRSLTQYKTTQIDKSYPLCLWRDRSALRRSPPGIPVGGCPRPPSLFIILCHRPFQPSLDQMQHLLIDNSTGNAHHQFNVRYAIKITR
jgi:site-specific DNA recombinase